MRNSGLPRVKNILKAPKMKPPKKEWEEEFGDELTYNVDYKYAYSWTKMNIETLFRKYFGRKCYQKIKIKVRKGCIQIEKIK